jgi:hypothetical protein
MTMDYYKGKLERKLTRVFLICGSVLIIIEIYNLNPSIITLKSFKTS